MTNIAKRQNILFFIWVSIYKNVFFEFQCVLGSLEVCGGGLPQKPPQILTTTIQIFVSVSFGYSNYLTQAESNSICLCVTGLFHLA